MNKATKECDRVKSSIRSAPVCLTHLEQWPGGCWVDCHPRVWISQEPGITVFALAIKAKISRRDHPRLERTPYPMKTVLIEKKRGFAQSASLCLWSGSFPLVRAALLLVVSGKCSPGQDAISPRWTQGTLYPSLRPASAHLKPQVLGHLWLSPV